MTFNHEVKVDVEGIGWCITCEDNGEGFQSYMVWTNMDAVSEKYEFITFM